MQYALPLDSHWYRLMKEALIYITVGLSGFMISPSCCCPLPRKPSLDFISAAYSSPTGYSYLRRPLMGMGSERPRMLPLVQGAQSDNALNGKSLAAKGEYCEFTDSEKLI